MKRGVYFLANNKVYDFAIAFLNSFRVHNKEIDLCLIPYDEDSEKIIALRNEYNFTIFDNNEILERCDNISIKFHQKKLGTYRKLAAWEGPFDEFIYIDLDTVVLDNVDFVFEHLCTYSVFTSHSNLPELVQWVWNKSIYQKNTLSLSQIEYSANTGFFVSKKGVFSLDFIQSKVSEALTLKDDMVLFCMEQPFLNYLIVSSVANYSSLSQMLLQEDNLDIKLECWGGSAGGIIKNGKFYIPNSPPFFLLHWAGFFGGVYSPRRNNFPYKSIWLYYRNLNPKYSLSFRAKLFNIFRRKQRVF